MYLDLVKYNKSKPRRKAKKAKGTVYGKYTPPKFERYVPSRIWRPDTPEYKSVTSTGVGTEKPERKEYTGTLIKGIATMHKSNAVPIINDNEAKDISRMRRG